MKGLIILSIVTSYAMGIIIESSSHYVSSGEKSKPMPMPLPIMNNPTVQAAPILQVQNDAKRDYVQANDDGNDNIKQSIPMPVPNQNTEQVMQTSNNDDPAQNDDRDMGQIRLRTKRSMRKTIPY